MLDETSGLSPFVTPHQYEWFVRGELALAANDLDAAASAFAQARLGPDDDALIVSRLAETELRRGDLARARALVRVARSLDPASEPACLVEGAIAEHEGREEGALRAYEAAIAIAPRSDLGPLAAARVLVRTDRAPEALAVLEALAARAPGSLAADRARFEIALTRLELPALQDATRALLERSPGARDRVLEAARGLASTHPELALVLVGADREDDARAVYLTALAHTRDVPALERALASTPVPEAEAAALFMLAGDANKALEALDGAHEDAAVRCARTRALRALGREAPHMEGCEP